MLHRWLSRASILLRQDGQDLAEYALLTGLIAIVVMAAVLATGVQVEGLYDGICQALAALV